MAETKKSLVMSFKTADNKVARVNLSDVKSDLTEQGIKTVMNGMVTSNIFTTKGGAFTGIVGAEIIDRTVNAIVTGA